MPGDVVLADRGFIVKDSVQLCFAQLVTPAFKKGKQQLTAREVEDTRNLAAVRIHIERVIGTLKQKYTILSSTLPIVLLSKRCDNEFACLDKIVVVCCALLNLCPSVIQQS